MSLLAETAQSTTEEGWVTPEKYLSFVDQITTVYSLNSFKDRLVKAYGTNPHLDAVNYQTIWREMHRKAKALSASWNTYRKRFLLND